MARFGISVLFLVIAVYFRSGKTTPDQLFRDFVRDPNVAQQWNNQLPTVTQPAAGVPLAPFTQARIAAAGVDAGRQYDEHVSNLIASNVLRFAHDIGRQLSDSAYGSKSEIFSPLSVMSALALLMLGAKGNSYQELKQVFGLNADPYLLANPSKFHEEFGYLLEDLQGNEASGARMRSKPSWRYTQRDGNMRGTAGGADKAADHIVRVANGLFSQTGYSLNEDYRHVIKAVYRSELAQLDFQKNAQNARSYINSWVNRNTYGKIPTIIEGEISSTTNVIIASALYFKGFWENSFFESATMLDNFYPNGLQQPPVRVKMMATGGTFPYYEANEYACRIIGLPYKGNDTTMYVIQPLQSSRTELRNLVYYLDAYKIEDMISKMSQKLAVLAFPKLHFVRKLNMKNMLRRMNVNAIFENGQSDLSLIANVQSYTTPPVNPINSRDFSFNRFGEFNGTAHNQTANSRPRRQAVQDIGARNSLNVLEAQRNTPSQFKPELFVEEILHKVDFDVNEHGTEAAAATLTYLKRSGTDVLFRADTPFLILIRHDPTKLILFYGIINEPES